MLRDLRGGFMQSDNLEMEDLLISELREFERIPHSRVVPLFLLL